MSKKNKSRNSQNGTDYMGKSKLKNNQQTNNEINEADDCKNCADNCKDCR